MATAPRQLWCWDLTFLASQVIGRWFYLYVILDVYSRKIVGFEVHETDNADHAAHLARRTALAEGVHASHPKPVLHGDNGATLKATNRPNPPVAAVTVGTNARRKSAPGAMGCAPRIIQK